MKQPPEFNDARFWKKVERVAGKVPFVPDAVAMYFCMLDPATPLWAKGQIAVALAYFVWPVDAIPDPMPPPPVGYADDALVVSATLAVIGSHITRAHHDQARAWLDA